MKAEDLINSNSLSNISIEGDQTVVFTEIALTAVNMARIEDKKSPWISVEEQLPDTDNGQSLYEVLAQTCDGRFSVFANVQIEDLAKRGEVVRWMPIPE